MDFSAVSLVLVIACIGGVVVHLATWRDSSSWSSEPPHNNAFDVDPVQRPSANTRQRLVKRPGEQTTKTSSQSNLAKAVLNPLSLTVRRMETPIQYNVLGFPEVATPNKTSSPFTCLAQPARMTDLLADRYQKPGSSIAIFRISSLRCGLKLTVGRSKNNAVLEGKITDGKIRG